MILSGTVTSAAVQGTTVSGAADDNPLLGFGVVGTGSQWVGTPGPNVAIVALGTLSANATATVDWTLGGYYTMTLAGSGTNVITFKNAAGTSTPRLGQLMRMRITGGGGADLTFPGTTTFIAQGVASSTTKPTMTGSLVTDFQLICTGTGSSPTYDCSFIQS